MRRFTEPGMFKPKPSRTEAKGDATTKVARDITDSEEAARIAKTERLRAARLAHEDAAPVEVETRPKPASRKPSAKARHRR